MTKTIHRILRQGPATSRQLQDATGHSQPVVSRLLQEAGDQIVRRPEGRAILYALARDAFGSGGRIPVSRISPVGALEQIAVLRPIYPRGYVLEPGPSCQSPLLGHRQDGWYDALPYWILDLAPQGFLGRQIARHLHDTTGFFPADPRYWTEEHIGQFLLANGEDNPGDLVLGQPGAQRIRRLVPPLEPRQYPDIAERVLAGEIPGSSAGGEQPKFTGYRAELDTHVIVKFSPTETSRTADRWRDILVAEHCANAVLRNAGIPAAETSLHRHNNQLFLESNRFDRDSMYGRSSMISLYAIDAEFSGTGGDWVDACQALAQQDLLPQSDVATASLLQSFGRLIYNADMHLGNLSLSVQQDHFRLLPVYDMSCMGFAPLSGGQLRPLAFSPPVSDNTPEAMQATDLAHTFWQVFATHAYTSDEMRGFIANMR